MLKIKLAPHVMDEGQPSAIAFMTQLQPTTIKVILDLDSLRNDRMMDVLRTAAAQQVLIVGRRWGDADIDVAAPNMLAEARRYYDGGGQTQSFTTLAQAFPMIQIWEGPNEVDVKTPAQMSNYAAFSYELARLMKVEAGRRAGLGAWAVGTPDAALWQHWRPALGAVLNFSAVLTRHSYGPVAGEEGTWFALRHQRDQSAFTLMGYPDMPLLITECGTDTLWNVSSFNKPWRELFGYDETALTQYWAQWGKPFAEAIAQDPYVLGAHWFTFGNGGGSHWDKYDLAHLPVAETILANPPAPIPEPWPSWATHRVAAARLNVREFPWLGQATPDIMGQLSQGAFVKSYCLDAGWHRIGADGNMWVSGRYLQAKP
jgi:hypothetical protein